MKMPATTNTKVEAKPTAEVGDAAKQCINCLEKKVRNLEKRKGRIEQNQEKAEKGSKLEKEQEISLRQYEQVTHDLEFARELHKQFLTIYQEHEKMVKRQAKREKAERQGIEIKRISEILQLQSTLDLLGGDNVREDFKTGKHGAVVLTDDNLDQLDQLYQVISPSRDDSGIEYPQRLLTAAEYLVNIMEGKDRQVMGTTYKELKELLTLISDCGYFEKVKQATSIDAEAEASEEVEESAESVEEPAIVETISQIEEQEDNIQQQPVDLTTDGGTSHMATQPMNTLEQDAFFAPSSTTSYQSESEFINPTSHAPQQANDFQSFTNNRPFQFIQASYVMSEQQANHSPSVVDPAVIHAEPAAGSNLQFMTQSFESTTPTQSSQPTTQQNSSQPPSQPGSGLGMADLNQSSLPQVNTSAGTAHPPTPQEFGGPQSFGQSGLQQNLQTEGLFPVTGAEEVSIPLNPHTGLMGQMQEDTSSYEIPPSIPLPPSQNQDQSQLDPHQQQQLEEKKFQMNVSAPVFQSMYAQQVAAGSVPASAPPPTVQSDSQSPQPTEFDVQNSNSDYQQGYQGNNGFNNGVYSRNGGRGGSYRGPRNGGGPAGPNRGARNGGGNSIQNGFGGRGGSGPNTNNSRGGRGSYSYPPNTSYRNDNYPNSYQAGGFAGSGYQKRGGLNNPSGPPGVGNTGYTRAGPGGMRGGGMHRGSPRGQGVRGGFNRPPPNQ